MWTFKHYKSTGCWQENLAFSYNSIDVNQRNSFKSLLWPERQIEAELYKQLPFGYDLKKKYKDMHLASILSLEFKRADFIIFFQSLFVYAHWSNNTAYFVAISHQTFPAMNYSKKNPNMIQGLSAWNFHSRGIEERAHENISVQLKRSGITGGSQRKNNVKFPWVLVFELGVSKRWHTILQNCQGWKLVFSKISKGKVTNLKIPERVFQKSVTTTQLVWSFSGIAQWAGEFDPKSQITILVAWQLELFQNNIPNRGESWGLEISWGYIEKT